MATTVKQLLDGKDKHFWSVSPDTMVFDALRLMADRDIGAVLVLEGPRLIGVFSERDYARKVILRGRSSKSTAVQDMMTRRIVFVRPADPLETCMKLMTAKHVRHLPVMDGDHLVGVISIGDVVKRLIADHEFTIKELEKYIRADGYV